MLCYAWPHGDYGAGPPDRHHKSSSGVSTGLQSDASMWQAFGERHETDARQYGDAARAKHD